MDLFLSSLELPMIEILLSTSVCLNNVIDHIVITCVVALFANQLKKSVTQ